MPYRLRFDGVNDNVTIASGITGNIGTQTYSYRVKGVLNALPAVAGVTGAFAFIGTTATGQANGICVYSTGAVNVVSGNTQRYGTSAGFLSVGVPFDFTISHINTGAWTITDNITSTVVASGTYATSTSWSGALNNIGRLSSAITSYLSADIDFVEVTGHANANKWDAGLSDGTGTVLPTTSGTNQGTLVNFTVPDCWIFYSTGSSFTGTIGKTSLTSTTNQLLLSLGYSVSTGKSTLTLNPDQLSVSVGTVLGVGKQSLVLNTKPETANLGYVNVLSKQAYTLLTKQLSVVVGANTPFTGVLNKTTYSLSGKQLSVNAGLNLSAIKKAISVSPKQLNTVLGWNSGVSKQSLNVSGKQESTQLGYLVDINELNLAVAGKPFSIQTGTSISFIGELSRGGLNLTGKPLSVSAGTSIPFIGLLGKTSLSLSGKALSRLHGQILDVQKQSVSLVTKQLSIGEVVYPIIPVERLFTFTDKGRTYLFKQTTNIYLISNRNNTFVLKGK